MHSGSRCRLYGSDVSPELIGSELHRYVEDIEDIALISSRTDIPHNRCCDKLLPCSSTYVLSRPQYEPHLLPIWLLYCVHIAAVINRISIHTRGDLYKQYQRNLYNNHKTRTHNQHPNR